MKVIVVGATSFTGQNFCRYAKEKGADVEPASLRYMHWIGGTNGAEGNYVVNFAAVNVVAPSWQKPQHYLKVNVNRITEMMDGLRMHMPQKYVHVSTPEVYGNTVGLVTEEDLYNPHPYNPSTPYAVSRAASEMMLKCYHKQYGLPVVFTRSANVYGPGQQLYRLIPKLIVSIKKGIKFPLEGGGLSERSFVHVRDVCAATWRVMLAGEPGEAYHISTQPQYSILGIVHAVCHAMGTTAAEATTQAPERPGKDASYNLSSQKVRKLDWEPTINFMDGVDEVIKWVNDNWDKLKDQSLEYIP